MLRKMLIHGLIAAAVVGAAAAVYAAGRGGSDPAGGAGPAVHGQTGNPAAAGNGYIADVAGNTDRNRAFRRTHRHERAHERYGKESERGRKRGHRDDD